MIEKTADTLKTPSSAFLIALGTNFIFINISEIFRYFVFVMPMMREAFPQVENVAPMDVPVFMVWGVWMTILLVSTVTIIWLVLDRFGDTITNAVLGGTLVWATIFVLLWLGLYNMNLATPPVIMTALPLAWAQLVISGLITLWARRRFHA